jgi:hypothetical protein
MHYSLFLRKQILDKNYILIYRFCYHAFFKILSYCRRTQGRIDDGYQHQLQWLMIAKKKSLQSLKNVFLCWRFFSKVAISTMVSKPLYVRFFWKTDYYWRILMYSSAAVILSSTNKYKLQMSMFTRCCVWQALLKANPIPRTDHHQW